MAIDSVKVALETEGFELSARKIKDLVRIFEALGSTDLSKLLKQLKEEPKAANKIHTSIRRATQVLNEYGAQRDKLASKGLDLASFDQKIGNAIKSAGDNLKVGAVKIDQSAARLQQSIDRIKQTVDIKNMPATQKLVGAQAKQLPDESAKQRAARAYTQELAKQFEEQNKLIKKDEKRLDLIQRYKKALAGVRTTFGISKPDEGAPQATKRGYDAVANEIVANNKNANAIRKTTSARMDQNKVIEEQKGAQDQLNRSIGVAVGKLIRYRIAFYSMRTAIRGTKQSIQDFVELQYQLADLEKVIDRQTESIVKYREEAFSLAQKFGVAVKDIVSSFKTWRQTGLQQEEVFKATEATLIGVSALGATTKEVTEALTAAIFTYGVEVENVTTVISQWLAVQKEFPISANDLANSLKVVGAAAQVVGVSLQDLSGYVAAIGSSTRKTGRAVGNSLKTMFARLPRKKTIGVFEQFGIAVLKNANELRDLDDVLDDLSGKWDSLSSVERANIAITVGGIRRYSDFIALMDNYETKIAATISAQKAQTEGQEAALLSLSTMKKEFDSLKAVVEEFGTGFGQILAGPLRGFIDAGTQLAKWVNSFGDVFPRIVGGITAFTAALVAVGVPIIAVRFSVSQLRNSLRDMAVNMGIAKAESLSLGAALKVVGKSAFGAGQGVGAFSKAVSKTNLIMFAITTVASLAAAAWTAFGKKQRVASDAVVDFSEKTRKSIKQRQDYIDALEREIKLYEKMPSKLSQSQNEIARLEGTEQAVEATKRYLRLINTLPKENEEVARSAANVVSAEASQKSALDDLTSSLEKYNEELRTRLEREKEIQEANIEDKITEIEDKLKANNKAVTEGVDIFKRSIETNNEYEKSLKKIVEAEEDVGNAAQNRIREIYSSMRNPPAMGESLFGEAEEAIGAQFESIKSEYEKQFNIAKDDLEKIAGSVAREFFSARGWDQEEFDVGFISTQMNKMNDTFDRLLKQRKTILEESGKSGIVLYEELYKALPEIAKQAVDAARKEFDVSEKFISQFSNFIVGKSGDLRELLIELKAAGEPDERFIVGRKPIQSAIDLENKIRDLIVSIKYAGEEFETMQDSLKFGEVVSFDEFRSDRVIKFIQDYQKNIREARQEISELSTKQSKLNDIIGVFNANIAQDERFKALQEKFKEGKLNAFQYQEAVENLGEAMDQSFRLDPEGIDKLKDLLSGLDLETQSKILGSEKPLTELLNVTKDVNLGLVDMRNVLYQIINNTDYKKAINALELINKVERDRLQILNLITAKTEANIFGLELQQYYYSKMEDQENSIFILEKHRLAQELEMAKAQAKYLTGQEKQNSLIKAEERYAQGVQKALSDLAKAKIDKFMENAADNARVLEESLSGAFSNIPGNILDFAEKRRDIEKEIEDAQYELNQARAEGDKDSIQEAQRRIQMAKDEMETYRRGWKEVKALVIDVFEGIGGSYWKKLSDRVAEDISNITLDGISLGDQVRDAMLKTTSAFTMDFRSMLEIKISEHANALERVLVQHALNISKIQDLGFAVSKVEMGGPMDKESIEELQNKIDTYEKTLEGLLEKGGRNDAEMTDKIGELRKEIKNNTNTLSTALKSAGALLAASFATSITGATGPGASAGSQVGAMFGGATLTPNAEGEILGKQFGSLAGSILPIVGTFAGGILGGLIGGLFDDEEKEYEPLQKAVIDNTEATINNTVAMKELEKSIFNAPTRFNVPAASGSFGQSPVIININGGSNTNAQAIRREIEDLFNREMRSSGTRGYATF